MPIKDGGGGAAPGPRPTSAQAREKFYGSGSGGGSAGTSSRPSASRTHDSWQTVAPPPLPVPEWVVTAWPYIEQFIENFHTTLIIAGFVPVVGEPADLASTAIDLAAGDRAGAALAAGAALPGLGVVGGAARLARRLRRIDRLSETLSAVRRSLGGAGPTSGTRLWSRSDFNGTRVYRRDDLIDPTVVDRLGRTNVQRMKRGLAPIGPDENPINLHHMLQTADGPVAEVTQSFHQLNHRTLHINPNTIPSGIDRGAFASWRQSYWQSRACDFAPC